MQLMLDLTNYAHPADPSDYADFQDFLCNAPKTDGRLGFKPSSRFYESAFIRSVLTPYGLHCLESAYIQLIRELEVFTFQLVKALAESPLPDASILNLIDNGIRIMCDDEPGELPSYTLTHYGYDSYHNKDRYPEDKGWGPCGCHMLVETSTGYRHRMGVDMVHFLPKARTKIVPFSERFVPRDHYKECDHPSAITFSGKPFNKELV